MRDKSRVIEYVVSKVIYRLLQFLISWKTTTIIFSSFPLFWWRITRAGRWKLLHTSINGHSHLTISLYNMCMYTSMFNTLFYILKCFMPYDFLSFFLHFSLKIGRKKWKISKKVPHNQNSPFRFIVILDTTKTHKLNILHLNLRFTGQLHQYIHTYIHSLTHKIYSIKYIHSNKYTDLYKVDLKGIFKLIWDL